MAGDIHVDLTIGTDKAEEDLEKVKSKAEKGGLSFAKMGAAAAIVTTAVVAIGQALDAATKRMTELNRAGALGVMAKDARRMSANLGGISSTMESLRDASNLVLAGFKGQEAEAGKLGRTISFITGVSKEAALEQIKAGAVSEEFLNQIGKSGVMVENALRQASLKLGRELDEVERKRVVFKYVNAGLAEVHRRAADLDKISPVAKLTANLKGAGEEIQNSLAPELVKLSDSFNKALPDIIGFVKGAIGSIRGLAKGAAEVWDFVSQKIHAVFESLPGFVKKAIKFAGDISGLGLLKAAKKGMAELGKMTGEVTKGAKDTVNAGAKGLDKALVALRKKRHGKKIGAGMKAEVLDELKGFQSESRAIIRDFESNFLNAVANLGGPVSGIFGAMRDAPEMFRKFATMVPKGQLEKYLHLTTQQVDELRKGKKITADHAKLQKILNLQVKAGGLDMREYLNNERIVNTQLKAGLSLFESQNKIAAANVELINTDKDIRGATVAIEMVIYELAKKKDAISKSQVKFLEKSKADYLILSAERKRMLSITKEIALVEQEATKRTEKFARNDARVEAQQRLLGLQKEIDATRGKSKQADLFGDDAAAKIREIQTSIRDMAASAALLETKLAKGAFADKASQVLARQQIDALKERITLRAAEIDKVHELKRAQLESVSALGTFMSQARGEVAGFSQQLGQQLYQGVQGGVQGIGNIVSSTMEMVVSGVGDAGANAGKLFLDVLAGAAAQLGAFYITAGTAALFVPPYTGAGSIAGGIGLLALAGTLKGLGSLVGASASKPSVSSSAGAAPKVGNPPTLPGQKAGDERAVNFFFASSPLPWQQVSEQQQVREMSRWGNRMAGEGRNPYNVPKALNARRFA